MGEDRFEFLSDDARGFPVPGFPIEFHSTEFFHSIESGNGFHVGLQSRIGYAVERGGGRVAGAVNVQSANSASLEAHLSGTERGAGRSVEPCPTYGAGGGIRIRYPHVSARRVSGNFEMPGGGESSDSHVSVLIDGHSVDGRRRTVRGIREVQLRSPRGCGMRFRRRGVDLGYRRPVLRIRPSHSSEVDSRSVQLGVSQYDVRVSRGGHFGVS